MSAACGYRNDSCSETGEMVKGVWTCSKHSHADALVALRAENVRLRGVLAEIQFDCEHLGGIQQLDKAERRTWVSVARRIGAALQPERGKP